MKSFPERPVEKLEPNESAIALWKNIITNFVTELPEAQGYDVLLVTCCHHTKQAHIIPTHSTVMAQGLATLFRDNAWKLHGLPEMALSDWGPQFAAEFMCKLNTILKIQTKLSTAYHPQTDEQTERLNQNVEQYLRLTPLLHTNYAQMFLKDWYLNHLKIYANLSIFSLTWKSKSKNRIVLWINFPVIHFQSYLIGLSYLISDCSGVWLYICYYKIQGHMQYTYLTHGQCMHHCTVEEQVIQQKKRNNRKNQVISKKTKEETKGTG